MLGPLFKVNSLEDYMVQVFWTWQCYLTNNTDETGFSLMHFTVDFSYYSMHSLDSVRFFVSWVFDISLDVHLILHIDCTFLPLQSSSHWNPFPFGIYRGIKVLHIAVIFWHKESYLVRQKLLFPTPETIKGMCTLQALGITISGIVWVDKHHLIGWWLPGIPSVNHN